MKVLLNKYGLKDRDLKAIFDIFDNYPEIRLVNIFGSRAKGTFRSGSDIDLAILNEGVSDATIEKIKSDLEDSSLPYFVDLINFPTLKHPEFRDHIERVGKLFYKK